MMYRTDQVSNGVFYVMIKDRKDVQGNIDIKGDGIMNTTDAEKRKILDSMKGLIVSCQVVPEDPIYTDDMVSRWQRPHSGQGQSESGPILRSRSEPLKKQWICR